MAAAILLLGILVAATPPATAQTYCAGGDLLCVYTTGAVCTGSTCVVSRDSCFPNGETRLFGVVTEDGASCAFIGADPLSCQVGLHHWAPPNQWSKQCLAGDCDAYPDDCGVHTTSRCPPGTLGRVVLSLPACAAPPVACPSPALGVQPHCASASAGGCPAGQAGATLTYQVGAEGGSVPVCMPTPMPCPAGEVGVTPSCSSAEAGSCGDGEAGATVTYGVAGGPPSTLDGCVEAPDQDGDGVPDDAEGTLCANENPNILSEGHCDGTGYVPPTPNDILSDILWLVTGERP